MTFQDYLSELQLDDLKLIAFTLGIESGLISRARLLRDIPEYMTEPGQIDRCLDALSPREMELLLTALFTGEKGYSVDARASATSGMADHLYGLLTRGLIIGRKGPLRGPEYIIPEDFREPYLEYFIRHVEKQLSGPPPAAVQNAEHTLQFIRDLFALLNGLRRDPARLTDRGSLYKRAQDTLIHQLEVRDTETSTDAPLPARLELMIEYGRSRRLIFEEDGRLRCSAAFDQWLHLPTNDKLDDVMAFWHTRNHGRASRIVSLLGVMQLCMDMSGVALDGLIDLTLFCSAGFPRQETSLSHHRQDMLDALQELTWLGMIQLYGPEPERPEGIVITPAGRYVLGNRVWDDRGIWTDRFVVQPTFEIIAPRTLDLLIREELERFADLVAVDLTLTYRITRDTMYRAGDEGMSGEAVIAFLERHSEKSIPQNVEYNIREWGSAYGQVYFMDVFLLRTADPEIAAHIKAHGELGRFVCGEVAPDALIIERHQCREMMELLRKAGYMPRTRIIGAEAERDAVHHPFARERFADVWNRPGNPRLTPAVIGIDECLPGYRLNRKLKSSDEDAPHLEQTDVMQYLSPRHTEELLELAIRYRHPVVIDYYIGNRNNSHMQRVRPLRIDRTRGSPYLEAFRLLEEDNRVFKIAQIKAIRVIYNEKE